MSADYQSSTLNPQHDPTRIARRQTRTAFLLITLLVVLQFVIEYSTERRRTEEIEQFLDPGPKVWLREGPGFDKPVEPPTMPSAPGEGGVERSARPATDMRA
jgi:hypothetical protein